MSAELFLSKMDEYSKREEGFKRNFASFIEQEANKIIDGLNEVNNNTLKHLDAFAVKVSTLRQKMAEAAENTLTINSLSGNSNTQFFISKAPIVSSNNIILDGNSIRLESFLKDVHQIFNVDIYTNGSLGNTTDYDEKRYYERGLITTSNHVEIESFNSGVSATITIDLKNTKVSNMIEFGYKEFGINAPSVGRVEISKDGIHFVEVATDVYNTSSKFFVTFKDSEVRVLRFTVSQPDGYITKNNRKRFPIGIYNLKIGVHSTQETGQIVFGPLSSIREIIKTSVGCEIPNDGYSISNTKFEISEDKETWREVSPPYTINKNKKVLDYNTVVEDAIRTEFPVKALYLRITLSGEKISKTYSYNSAYNKHTQTVTTTQPSVYLPFDFTEDAIVGRNTGVTFGDRITYTVWNDTTSSIDNSESIRVNDDYVIKSLNLKKTEQKVTVRYPLVKCTIEKSDNYKIRPMRTGDIYSSKFYRMSDPIKRELRISSSDGIVIPFSEPAGVYTLTDGKIYRKIDLTSGFFTSAFQWAYERHPERVSLLDPVGEEVHIFNPDEEISLLKYFTIEEPKQAGSSPVAIKFNREYPHRPLSADEFSIVNGKGLSGLENAIIEAYTCYTRQIEVNTEFGVDDIVFTASDVSLSRYKESLSRFDGKNMAKLSKTGILKGSVKFDYSNASIFSFIEEVDYIDGITEFNTGNRVEVQVPANVNQFSLGALVDHFSEIKFIGYSTIFSNRVFSENELISSGDYMLKNVSPTETYVILPPGIKTHDIINTKAVIDIPIDAVGNGYFSIDYNNGIIYSQTKIDGNTSIEYINSNIFMSGKEMIYIPKSEYNVSNRNLQFNSMSDETSITIVSKMSEVYKLDIHKSPVVNEIMLNVAVV